MAIEFNVSKSGANPKKHGVSFSEAQAVLFDPLAVTIEDLSAIGERRYVTVGLASSGELLVVVYAERNRGYRLISARKATPKERKTYES